MGRNEIQINQLTMIRIVEDYLDSNVLGPRHKVLFVRRAENSMPDMDSFIIRIEAAPKDEPKS